MTSRRFIRQANRGRFTPEKSAQMNRARWGADRLRRDDNESYRLREIEMWNVINLPRKQGDALGCLQWTDYYSGKVRKWVVRIGDRADRITVESPGNEPSKSHGWTWFLTQLRKHIS